jgi:glycosyltransferase involved in cell wall biosynthesis
MKKIKKICFLLGGHKLSGAEKRIILTAIKIANDKNYKVQLLTREVLRKEFLKSDLLDELNPRLTWKTRKLSSHKNIYIRRLYNSIANSLYNIIQVPWFGANIHIALFSNQTLISLLLIRLFGNSKFLFEITSPDVAVSSVAKNLIKYSFLSDSIICVSNSVLARLGLNNKDVVKVRRQPFAYVNENKIQQAKENIIVFAHRFISRKNPMLAAQAFSILSQEFKDWTFYICGSGDLKCDIEDIIARNNRDNLIYKGYVYDMDVLMGKSKIFVSLIEPDNYPSQSIFNAMANNNALIVSNTGESKKSFIDNNGYAVKLNLDDVVLHIRRLIEQDDLMLMGNNSRYMFESRYSQEKYLIESKTFYE